MAKQKKKAAIEMPDVSVNSQPKAHHAIRRARAAGALLAFLLCGLIMWNRSGDPFEAGIGALAGGILGGLIAWMIALWVWEAALQQFMRERRAEAEAELRRKQEMLRKAMEEM